SVPITVGTWYIKDFYGFGYKGATGDPTVNVYIRVESPTNPNIFSFARLILYYANGTYAGTIDLTNTTTYGPYTLSPGQAFQLDLHINATSTGTASFKLGFYVTQSSTPEQPR
ncbi:MAG: hypothetical protein ABWK00_07070, partial [Desulfurococcaceae archaeon]